MKTFLSFYVIGGMWGDPYMIHKNSSFIRKREKMYYTGILLLWPLSVPLSYTGHLQGAIKLFQGYN